MGLKSTFSLAGLQTTVTRFNKSGLLYINTQREMSSSEGQRKKERKEEERDEFSEDKMRQQDMVMGDRRRECKSRFSVSRESSLFIQSPKMYRLLKVRREEM